MNKKLLETIIESTIKASGAVTTIAVLLIVYFLFTEGIGLFNKPAIQEGFHLVVHPDNPTAQLDVAEIRSIFIDRTITDWSEVSDYEREIIPLQIDYVDNVIPDSILSNEALSVFEKLEMFILQTPGVLAVIPQKFAIGNVVQIDNHSFSSFLFGTDWYPTSEPSPLFGVFPIIMATLLVTAGSIFFAIPIGLMVAIYLAEIAHPRVRELLKPLIELLAGVPSVVYGFFGLVVVVPFIQEAFDLPSGATALAGALMLAIISLPTIITLSDDAIRSVPRHLKESSLALGASHWQTIVSVTIPVALSGISSAAILGVGRSIGETMAVLMVTGNSAQMPTSILDSVRTITATIALELGEAPKDGTHYQALFILGCILFLMTFIINLIASAIAARQPKLKS